MWKAGTELRVTTRRSLSLSLAVLSFLFPLGKAGREVSPSALSSPAQDSKQGWEAGKAVGAMAIASVSSTGAGPWHDGRNGEEGVESAIQERKAVGVATIRSGWEEEDSAKCQKPVRCVRYARPGSFLHTQ